MYQRLVFIKKAVIILATILIIIYASLNIYHYYQNDKNNLTIAYYLEMPPPDNAIVQYVNMQLYLDNELLLNTDSIELGWNVIQKRVSLGVHSFKILLDKEYVKKYTIFVFPMKWIYIEYEQKRKGDKVFVDICSIKPVII